MVSLQIKLPAYPILIVEEPKSTIVQCLLLII